METQTRLQFKRRKMEDGNILSNTGRHAGLRSTLIRR